MQWSQIKTLFILTFFILNIFLFIQFYEKKQQSNLSMLEREESTIEQILEDENITLENLPTEELDKEPFVSVRQKSFTEDDERELAGLGKQRPSLVTNTFLVSFMDDKIKIPEDASTSEIEEVLADKLLYAEEYRFWDWNEELNILMFFQQINERTIFYNQSGMILLFLNDKNEVEFLTQTMLGEAEYRQDKNPLIEPLKAIEELYNANELTSGDEITQVEIGLHSRVPLSDGVQVFVPAWKVSVNDDKSFFVNAIEGHIFPSNELEFLEQVITQDADRVRSTMSESKLKEEILAMFEKKLELLNWGE
ncbi:two-component system regulatory protein YycI [Ornithinibacillus sp. 4-3]|uniref:Two-component system regulatory protein YycI n=1 Tax=Ornithinibacillus sp. 4-3 TaxID=3231488 RepID=A0AB39HQL3_9BACI